jgi:exosortase B
MSAVSPGQILPLPTLATWWRWLPVLGLLALFVPTFVDVAGLLWTQDAYFHQPLVLMVILWLLWERRAAFAALPERPAYFAGSICLAFGLLIFVLGRTQMIWIFSIGSLAPVLAGTLLLTHGWQALRLLWFPLVYVIFLVPLPGQLIDGATATLKQQISVLAEEILYAAGYPIARVGVTLSIGQYQLLVADACSGLHSIFSLSALGTLYLYLRSGGGWLRSAIVLCSIVPIAFAANVVRVIVLVLITYYWGDRAGQGFLHEFSGMVLFTAGLSLLIGVDGLAGLLFGQDRSQSGVW